MSPHFDANCMVCCYRMFAYLVLLLVFIPLSRGQEATETIPAPTIPSEIARSDAVCYEKCSATIVEASSMGLKPELCKDDSSFSAKLDRCLECLGKTRDDVDEVFDDDGLTKFLSNCNSMFLSPAYNRFFKASIRKA